MALLEKKLFVKKSTLPGAGKGLFTKTVLEKRGDLYNSVVKKKGMTIPEIQTLNL